MIFVLIARVTLAASVAGAITSIILPHLAKQIFVTVIVVIAGYIAFVVFVVLLAQFISWIKDERTWRKARKK